MIFRRLSEGISKARVVRFGDREIIAEGLRLNFWADISHRCMTASWPAFIGGAALVFVAFNAVFALLYWLGDQPVSNVPGGAYIDYLYFSIETLSTAGYGDMHPQTHYGHFIATVELFTGIFSMSLMTGLIFARFARPNARLLFAENPVVSNYEGKPTLMVRLSTNAITSSVTPTQSSGCFVTSSAKKAKPSEDSMSCRCCETNTRRWR